MKINLYDNNLKSSKDTIEVSDEVFGLEMNTDLVTQVLNVFRSNQRHSKAHIKTRAMVRGGGRKPFKQKGTGRARTGSTRNPIWVGGGNAFVPNERNWKRNINKKMSKKALKMVLSDAVRNEKFYVVNDLDSADGKALRNAITDSNQKFLFVSSSDNNKKVRNHSKVSTANAMTLNSYEVVNAGVVVIDQESLDKISQRLA